LAVVTDVYSPKAIENEPANKPATPLITTVCALAAAATPAINAVLLTRPSIAPKVAARSQPPLISGCVCPTSYAGSGSFDGSFVTSGDTRPFKRAPQTYRLTRLQ